MRANRPVPASSSPPARVATPGSASAGALPYKFIDPYWIVCVGRACTFVRGTLYLSTFTPFLDRPTLLMIPRDYAPFVMLVMTALWEKIQSFFEGAAAPLRLPRLSAVTSNTDAYRR